MLLTSGQVSVAISSFIVFIFTLALFLSGYVLQQHTLRDLRAAIKPQLVRQTGPDLYLPPQFRDDPAYNRRGVVDAIAVNQEEKEEEKEKEKEDDMIGATRWQKEARRKKLLEEKDAGQKLAKEGKGKVEKEQVKKEKEHTLSAAERRRRIKEQILAEGEGEVFKGYRRRMW